MRQRIKQKKEEIKKCIVEICRRKVQVKKHQLCFAHYIRWSKHGDISAEIPIQNRRCLEPYKPRKKNKEQ